MNFNDFEIKTRIYVNKNKMDELQSKKKIFGFLQMKLSIKAITKEFQDSIRHKLNKKQGIPIIKLAKEWELNDILNIYNRSFLSSNTPFQKIEIDFLKELYNIPEISFYIARYNGVPAGFMILDFEGDNKEYGFITALGILPRFQGKRIGTLLGIQAWNHFKEKNIEELRCEVYFTNQKSISFLKSLKFEEFAIR
ncbi:MAG: GNAT family N-acetyltransferase [Promethearchaeota archaeon]